MVTDIFYLFKLSEIWKPPLSQITYEPEEFDYPSIRLVTK